jgi:SHS2 domain-containing protein
MFETFDHTADLGLHVQAATLPELLQEAGRGLLSVLVDNPQSVQPAQEHRFHNDLPGGTITADEAALLLFDWLSELLYLFETEHLLGCEFELDWSGAGVTTIVRGEPVDPDRHQLAHEVKAVTYHQLAAVPTETGWDARVILDI